MHAQIKIYHLPENTDDHAGTQVKDINAAKPAAIHPVALSADRTQIVFTLKNPFLLFNIKQEIT